MRWGTARACRRALQERFGVKGYRPGQRAATRRLLSGRDLFCILPTGAGKSLCWQLPAVVHGGLTIVFSPLIALMTDQVEGLRRRGIPSVSISSAMSREEQLQAAEDVISGRVNILFVAPERMKTREMARIVSARPPWLIVVDEAHCVIQWAGEFRPDYGRIGAWVSRLPARPVLCALTATADPAMTRGIIRSLGMQHPRVITLPVLRPNLIYSVRTVADPLEAVLGMMREKPCCTAVFCKRREHAETLSEYLRSHGVAAEYYHAGLDRETRSAIQERFRTGETPLLACTSAFGMGVDIPGVRRVVHLTMPMSVIDYAQQSGRAGRDGLDSECIVLLSPGALLAQGIHVNYVSEATMGYPRTHFPLMHAFWRPQKQALQVTLRAKCIPAAIAAHFHQRVPPCGRCSACLKGPLYPPGLDLQHMNGNQLLRKLVRWQLGALAKKRGVPLRRLLPLRALWRIRVDGEMPPVRLMPDPQARQALERLLRNARSRWLN